jgi:hypothetical protein
MLIFDLICSREHCFEGWFANLADLEDQLGKGLIACPVCGDVLIARRPSTFGVVKSRPRDERAGSGAAMPQNFPEAANGGGEVRDEKADFMEKLEIFSRMLRKNFTDVGTEFAAEALKIHYGVTEGRNIYGSSTLDEEEMLRKEGVKVWKFPMVVRKSDTGVN